MKTSLNHELLSDALDALKKGPSYLEELEEALFLMDKATRRALAKRVEELNLNAPRCVFYDYKAQEWLI